MAKFSDKFKHSIKVATIVAGGLFGAQQAEARGVLPEKTSPATTASYSVPQEFIGFKYHERKRYFQVDTVYDAKIIEQVANGTYNGSIAYYSFENNITTKYYFSGVDKQPNHDSPFSVDVHEGAHDRYVNTYGLPIGKITPAHAYSLEIALEFNAYLYQTIYEMNLSVPVDSIIGMLHDSHYEFGNMLQKGLLHKYTSAKQQDREEVLRKMTNSLFENTYLALTSSPLYSEQLLKAARYISDVQGYPQDIKDQNFQRAVKDAFTIQAQTADGESVFLNLYDYLTPENKKLVTMIPEQHRDIIRNITIENSQKIFKNTQERQAKWRLKAKEMAADGKISEDRAYKMLQKDFNRSAVEFSLPENTRCQKHDALHHVSEVMVMPDYDASFHLAPDYKYTVLKDRQDTLPADNLQTNLRQLNHIHKRARNLSLRKSEQERQKTVLKQNTAKNQALNPKIAYRNKKHSQKV